MCALVSLFLTMTPILLNQGPTPMTSFDRNHLLIDHISKYRAYYVTLGVRVSI